MNIGKENETIEFKKSTSETKEAVISIASILNKHNNGTVYFGVKDNGDVVGQEIGKDTQRKLSRDISDNIKPAIWYEIKCRNSDEGLKFIEVDFSGDNSPYSAYGKYYQRFSDEDKQISDTELEKLFKMRRKDYSEWENTDSDETADDTDEGLIKSIIERGNESGRINYSFSDSASILTKLGLLNKKSGHLNNAGKVLFSKNKPILLKTAVYATETKDTFIKLNHFEGNIYECIDEAMTFILSSIDWEIKFVGNAERNEKPEIPQTAIREMVVNAFAHGSYSSNTTFAVEIFSDKVIIYSPGMFPAGLTPEDFAGSAAEPVMLNPKIVNVLFKSGEIESFGSGFERTFNACQKEKVKYSYENLKTGFKFVFYRSHGHKNVYEMSITEKQVYDLLKECDYLTNQQIADKIGKSTKTVYRAIKALKENGYICREGNNNNGYWIAIK